MSDSPTPAPSAADAGVWAKYRALPMWAQVLIPLAIIAVIVLVISLLTGGSDESSSADTSVPAGSSLDDVLKGLIVVGGLNNGSTTTTAAPTTTVAPTTTAAGTVAPTAAPTTAAPTTAAPTTAAPTTEAPTTEAPTTTVPASALPAVADFVSSWNSNASGTKVPSISAGQATELTGQYAGYYLITLSPSGGNKLPPQVGIVAQVTAPGSGQLSQIGLVWITGADDEAQSAFYWEAFEVMVKSASPGISDADIAALEKTMGRAEGVPPFSGPATATAGGLQYNRFLGQPTNGVTPSVIKVS